MQLQHQKEGDWQKGGGITGATPYTFFKVNSVYVNTSVSLDWFFWFNIYGCRPQLFLLVDKDISKPFKLPNYQFPKKHSTAYLSGLVGDNVEDRQIKLPIVTNQSDSHNHVDKKKKLRRNTNFLIGDILPNQDILISNTRPHSLTINPQS